MNEVDWNKILEQLKIMINIIHYIRKENEDKNFFFENLKHSMNYLTQKQHLERKIGIVEQVDKLFIKYKYKSVL